MISIKTETYDVNDSIQFSINQIMGSIDEPIIFTTDSPSSTGKY